MRLRPCENTRERGFRVPQESWLQPPVVVEPQRAPRLKQVEPRIQTDEHRFSVIDDCPLDGLKDFDERVGCLPWFSSWFGLGQGCCSVAGL